MTGCSIPVNSVSGSVPIRAPSMRNALHQDRQASTTTGRERSRIMNFRITDDGNDRDINEIHEMLREYNLRHREASENVPLGIFLEDENGKKLAGLTGETFGNWLCIRFLFVGEPLRGRGDGKQAVNGCGKRSPTPRLQVCFCGHFLLSGTRILRKAWISGGLYPRRISVHREKALLHERITLMYEIHGSIDRNKRC